MIRICTSLANNGFAVTFVGRKMKDSITLVSQPFQQKRLNCFFSSGPGFYIEYNLRLFCWLLLQQADCLCAIDLDTILPVLFASKLKGSKRVYDAHELFCEMKEIVTRPSRYRLWKRIEKFAVPKFQKGYTVNIPIATELKKMYDVNYEVIRNVPLKEEYTNSIQQTPTPFSHKASERKQSNNQPFFIYQGAVNEGRSFETLIPAMQQVNLPLHIYGDGNFLVQTKNLIEQNKLQEKVLLKGKLEPAKLKPVTANAYAGITLFENNGLSNYLSAGNRFFDFIMAGIPQLCVDYPFYREINQQFEVALLIADTKAETIAAGLNILAADLVLYKRLQNNCVHARAVLNWEEEEKKLIAFYKQTLD